MREDRRDSSAPKPKELRNRGFVHVQQLKHVWPRFPASVAGQRPIELHGHSPSAALPDPDTLHGNAVDVVGRQERPRLFSEAGRLVPPGTREDPKVHVTGPQAWSVPLES
jgi:hypothetical protein